MPLLKDFNLKGQFKGIRLSFLTSALGAACLIAPAKAQITTASEQAKPAPKTEANVNQTRPTSAEASVLDQLLTEADTAAPLSVSQSLALSQLMELSAGELRELEEPQTAAVEEAAADGATHEWAAEDLLYLVGARTQGVQEPVPEAFVDVDDNLTAQIASPSTEELTEEEQEVIPPGTPVNSRILFERRQGEVEGEVDESVLRQVPDPDLLRDEQSSTYSIQIAPTEDSQIRADRRSTILLGGSITDGDGNVLDNDIVVTLSTSAGEFIGADYDIDRVGYQVLARRGEFNAELRSSLDAQRVIIRASAARDDLLAATPLPLPDNLVDGPREIDAYTEVSFATDLRPSLVTGIVDLRLGPAATNLWGSFRDFLRPEDIGDTNFDARTAVFATGVLGDWLFTGAYNSDRNLNDRCDSIGTRLYGDACEPTYPVYGDSSTNDFLTPSQDSLYLRFQQDAPALEAEPNFFMWGDYSTNEFSRPSQLFSATSRQLHGFMGNYTIGGETSGLQLTAMYADNIRPFKRDTIVPDGTSGYYFLSEPLVLSGSEEIYIEVEELNRPGTVVERVALTRGADYRIDYDRGAILFTQPVSVTDANPFGQTLVRRIVASYQVEGEETGGSLYGGRAQYNFSYDLDFPSWLGASVITEDNNATDFTLYGVDALFSLGDRGQIVGEYARSSLNGTTNADGDGSAYRIEASGDITDRLFGLAYLRGADSDFSNNSTTSFRPGQTRWGAELQALLGSDTLFEVKYDQEENRGTAPAVITGFDNLRNPGFFAEPGASVDNSLTTVRAGLQQQIGDATADLSYVYRDRNDRIGNLDFSSSQIVSGLTLPLASNLAFRAQNEFNIGGDDDPVYPSRTVLGLDYTPIPEITVRLAQQFFGESDVAPDSITSLDTLLNYDLTDSTQLSGRYSVLGGYDGRVIGQGAVGLNHRWNLAPGLNMDLGYERVMGEGLGIISTGERFEQPFAVGQSAAALGISPGSTYSVGLEYLDNSRFQASARAEFRDSDNNGDNTVLTAALAGKLSPSITALGRYEYANYANQTFTERFNNSSSLRLGMAYRNPSSDKFNALLSYEYATNPALTINSAGSDDIDEHTLAAEAIYAPNYRWEFYGKYGLRYTNADLSSLGLSSVSNTIHLAQLRTAYRLGYRWDLAGEVRYISQPSVDYDETAFALETGYYLTPDLRFGVGYSFGAANDRSFQGSGYRDEDGFYLAATFKVNELFNGFGLQDPSPAQQTESLVSADEATGASNASPVMQGERSGTDIESLIFGTPNTASDSTDADSTDADSTDASTDNGSTGNAPSQGLGASDADSSGADASNADANSSNSDSAAPGTVIPVTPNATLSPTGASSDAAASDDTGTSAGAAASPAGTSPDAAASPTGASPATTSPTGASPSPTGTSPSDSTASPTGASAAGEATSNDTGTQAPASATPATPSEPIRGLW
ncbi:MAG: TonB-dependent receptor [Cyanobacteria bacterium P01_F01_bin.53]